MTTMSFRFRHCKSGVAITSASLSLWRLVLLALVIGVLASPSVHGQNTHRAQFVRAQAQGFTAADSTSLSITSDFTLESWVKFSTLPAIGQEYSIFTKWVSLNNRSYYFSYLNSSGVLNFHINTSPDGSSATGGTIPYALSANTWYHLAVSKTGSTATIYVNGTSIGIVTVAPTTYDGTSTFDIGAAFVDGAGTSHFDGSIDDARVWSVARTQDQIRAAMFTELLGAEASLRGSWRLNNSLADNSTNGNTLTNVNGVTFATNDLPFAGPPLERCPDKDTRALYHLSDMTDASSNGLNLTDIGSVAFVPGRFGNGANFGNSNSNSALQSADNLGISGGPYTIGLWVKPNVEITSGGWALIQLADADTDTWSSIYYHFNGGSRQIRFYRSRSGRSFGQTNYDVTLGTQNYSFVAITYDGFTIRGYFNGILVTSLSESGDGIDFGNISSELSIGAGRNYSTGSLGDYASAAIDEVFVLSRVSSDEEIMKYYGGIVSARYRSTAGANSPVDGYIAMNSSSSWPGTRDATTAMSSNVSGTAMAVRAGKSAGGNYDIARAYALFDTSSLPDIEVSVCHATFNGYVNVKQNDIDDGSDFIALVASTPASSANLAVTDFAQTGTTEFSPRYDITNVSNAAYLAMSLNSTGLDTVSKTGLTRLGIREGHDLVNSPITGANNAYNLVYFNSADSALNNPYLLVEYRANTAGLTIVGTVSYSGPMVGHLFVSVGGAPSQLNSPGAYSLGGLSPGVYSVTAYLDANNDGVHQPWEPEASYAGNPITLNGSLTGVDLTVALPPDTDNDGLSDTWEQVNGLIVGVNDALLDKDGDGLTNIQEYYLGTNPSSLDSDGDGVSDGVEYSAAMNPLSPDTDGDGMPDKWEMDNGLNPLANDAALDADGDGLTNAQEYNGGVNSTNPRSIDSNGNGVSDYEERNGVRLLAHTYDQVDRLISTQYATGAWESWRYDGNGNILAHTLKTARDADGDGLPDSWEVSHGLAINDGSGSQGAGGDADGDGWTNYQEFLAGTDPTEATSHPPTGGVAGAVWFNPPKARIIFPPANGGGLAHVSMKLWDAEANATQFVLQWFDAAAQQWKPATVARVDGAVFTSGSAVSATPGGTAHDLLWKALADLGNFNSTILLRAIVQDASGTTTSEIAPFAVNTTGDFDGDGLPDWWEIAMNLDPNDAAGPNGPNGNPDGDRLTNLAEFAYGLNPQAFDPIGASTITAQVNPADGKTYLTVTYRRRTDAPTLVYEIQTTTDLITWTTSGADIEPISVVPGGNGLEIVTVRIHPPLGSAGTPEKFVRVRVQLP